MTHVLWTTSTSEEDTVRILSGWSRSTMDVTSIGGGTILIRRSWPHVENAQRRRRSEWLRHSAMR